MKKLNVALASLLCLSICGCTIQDAVPLVLGVSQMAGRSAAGADGCEYLKDATADSLKTVLIKDQTTKQDVEKLLGQPKTVMTNSTCVNSAGEKVENCVIWIYQYSTYETTKQGLGGYTNKSMVKSLYLNWSDKNDKLLDYNFMSIQQ